MSGNETLVAASVLLQVSPEVQAFSTGDCHLSYDSTGESTGVIPGDIDFRGDLGSRIEVLTNDHPQR
jgi:hypothetical protein